MEKRAACEVCKVAEGDEDESLLCYLAGKRSALLAVLRHVLTELGVDQPEVANARWVIERQEAIARLRETCAEYGDNDWEDELNLGDVIDKHLRNYLTEAAEEVRHRQIEEDLLR